MNVCLSKQKREMKKCAKDSMSDIGINGTWLHTYHNLTLIVYCANN